MKRNNETDQNFNDTIYATLDTAVYLLSTIFNQTNPQDLMKLMTKQQQWEFLTDKARFEMGVQWLNEHGANLSVVKEVRNYSIQDVINKYKNEKD